MYIEVLEEDVHAIIGQIRNQFNFDLSVYSVATVKRRIHRIMMLFHLRNSNEFIGLLKNDPTIFPHILNELTVNTTEMFRDITFWKTIKCDILPNLKSRDKIKIWHNACSSGEEVYSLLILALELGIFDQLEVYATDINTSRLKIAESGIFELKYIQMYQEYYEQLGGKFSLFDFGELLGDHYFQFNETLRKKVAFSYLDCIRDVGMQNCDLLFSRNMLMYLEMNAQERVFKGLLNSISPNGFLFIGKTEDLSWINLPSNIIQPFELKSIYKVT